MSGIDWRKGIVLPLIAAVAVLALAGSALARHMVRVSDGVTVALSPPKHFYGSVGGFKPARFAGVCAPGRKVVLNFRDAPNQSVTNMGTDRTDAAGNWSVDVQQKLHGQIQATVLKHIVKRNGKRILCRSAHTAFTDTK
jgi:hypothetical protein